MAYHLQRSDVDVVEMKPWSYTNALSRGKIPKALGHTGSSIKISLQHADYHVDFHLPQYKKNLIGNPPSAGTIVGPAS